MKTKEEIRKTQDSNESMDDEQVAFYEANRDLVENLGGVMREYYSEMSVGPEETHDHIYSTFFHPMFFMKMLDDIVGVCVPDEAIERMLKMKEHELRFLFATANATAAVEGERDED